MCCTVGACSIHVVHPAPKMAELTQQCLLDRWRVQFVCMVGILRHWRFTILVLTRKCLVIPHRRQSARDTRLHPGHLNRALAATIVMVVVGSDSGELSRSSWVDGWVVVMVVGDGQWWWWCGWVGAIVMVGTGSGWGDKTVFWGGVGKLIG